MEKKLKDYLHYYMGCNIVCRNSGKVQIVVLYGENLQKAINLEWTPVLRPLSSMTEDEKRVSRSMADVGPGLITIESMASIVNYLRKQFIDVDDLIESGLAIEQK